MNRLRTRTLRGRVTLFFVGFAVALLIVPGFFFYRTATSYLERELADRLKLGAGLAALQFEGETLLPLRAGDETTQRYALLQARLRRVQQATGAAELRLIDPQRLTLVSVDATAVGVPCRLADADAVEIGRAMATGEPQVSHLYGDGSTYHMAAYAPVRAADGTPVALLRLEGSPLISDFLAAYRDRILLFAAVVLCLSLLVSRVLSRQVIEPVRELAAGVRRLSERDYAPVRVSARDELGFLAEEFNRMAETIRGHAQELTALHAQAAQRAADLEVYNRYILETIRSGIVACQLDGTVTVVNRSARAMFALTAEVAGQPLAEVFAACPELGDLLTATLAQRENQVRDDLALTVAGRQRHFDLQTSLLHDGSGRLLGVILMAAETTRLRELQEEIERTERLAAVGTLAAGVAHEIRNPLSGISGFVELLQRKVTGNEAALRLTDKVRAEISHLNRIVTDFLQFARPQALNLTRVDLAALCAGAVAVTAAHAAERGVALRLAPGPPVFLTADGEQLRQALVNILRNAVEASAAGQAVVLAWTPDGMFATITVRDDGAGMDNAARKAIFNPFFTTKDDGTGLGLTVTHTIIERHGGHIRVDSEPGRGTVFTVALPLAGQPGRKALV